MALIDTVTNYDTAVWWAKGSTNEFGDPTFATPVEVDVRWTAKNEQILLPNGTTVLSNASVFIDRDVTVGDVLLHSELDSSVDQDNPKDNVGAWEVVMFEKIPNKRNTKYLRKVTL